MIQKIYITFSKNKLTIFKYIIVGLMAVVADNGLFYLFYNICDTPLMIATLTALISGFLVSFTGNKIWAFNQSNQIKLQSTIKQLSVYTLLFLFNLVFTYYLIFFIEENNYSANFAKFIATLLITTWNYVLYKYVIFK